MAAALAGVVLITAADVWTGPHVRLSTFYLLPVGFAAWFAGRSCGFLIAVAGGAGVWITGRMDHPDQRWCWDALLRLAVYMVFALLLSMLRTSLQDRDRLLGQLRAAMAREQEARVAAAETAAELALSNAELERYAAVAAHDLKSPLTAIGVFLELLGDSATQQPEKSRQETVRKALMAVEHMRAVVDQALQCARVRMETAGRESASADAALEQALMNLGTTIQVSNATVTRDAMPQVEGSTSQLTEVFENLLGNALKFRGASPPCIHVGVERRGDKWLFAVSDNGIGMDPAHTERIFEMFSRLNEASLYPGTGIGLATCRKIVTRHGGSIWAESQPGKGSTFFFTLPVSSSDAAQA